MILEIAQLQIKPNQAASFKTAFAKAEPIIRASRGYISHELQKCIEHDHQYVLLVQWQTLENHTQDFRNSAEYQTWKNLLHHFYDPFPTVLHYEAVQLN